MAERRGAAQTVVVAAVAIFALVFPFFASGYHLYQGAQVLILAIAVLGLNLLTGFNGQISLGHGAFFAIGGYGTAILIVEARRPLLGGDSDCGRGVFRRGIPVRLSRP